MDDLQILRIAQDPHDPDFIVCGTRPAEIFISQDNGVQAGSARYSIQPLSVGSSIRHGSPLSISIRANCDTIWITIEIDGVFRSVDRGCNWQRLVNGLHDNDTHDLVFLDQGEQRIILCSTEDGIHRSDDNGGSLASTRYPGSAMGLLPFATAACEKQPHVDCFSR